jgi:hypothetical protein
LDDQTWTTITTTANSFSDAITILSLPTGDNGSDVSLSVIPRVCNVYNSGGHISFKAKLYQPNDSYCSKAWRIPAPISPLLISWFAVEKGAYNISNNYFMAGSQNITRPSISLAAPENIQIVNYPLGCGGATAICRFPTGSEVATVTQIMTLANDRFLQLRGFSISKYFARYILMSHEAIDTSYYVITKPETYGYFAFPAGATISCSEGIGLEGFVRDPVTTPPETFVYKYAYFYAPGVYGMITSLNGQNPVTLRAFNRT